MRETYDITGLNINQILGLSWAVQEAFKKIPKGEYGHPQAGVVKIVKKAEKDAWARYLTAGKARKAAKASA